MKTRLLPEIDLARIAVLPKDQARKALEQMKFGHPPYSYAPSRQHLPDILNVEPNGFFELPRTEWSLIEAGIRRTARSLDEFAANLMVASALYAFSAEHEIRGRQHEFFPLAVGVAAKVTFWSKAVLSYRGGPLVPFIDPRQSKKLTAQGRRFVFSVMHERIRAADADFADVRLGIFQMDKTQDGARLPRLFTDEDVALFSFDEIDTMVRATYEMWFDVLHEREADNRRKSTGTNGPLFDF